MKKATLLLSLIISFFLIGSTLTVSAEVGPDMKKIDDNAFIVPDETDTAETTFDVSPSGEVQPYSLGIAARSKTITVRISGSQVPTTRYYSEYYNNRWYAGTLNLHSFNPSTKVATYSGILIIQGW